MLRPAQPIDAMYQQAMIIVGHSGAAQQLHMVCAK